MPNYNIPDALRKHITDNALKLANRPLQLALNNFPLTVAQLQYHCAALTEEQVDTLRRLDGEGVRTIEHHTQLRLAFIRDNLPELRRGVVLSLQLPEWIVVGKGTQWGIGTTKFKPDENHYIVPDLARLDGKSRKELVTWIERALRQVRLYEITDYMVTQALLTEHSPTTSHLHALWPTLTTLEDPTLMTYQSYKQQATRWQDRFRNPTRRITPYKPDEAVRNKFSKLILAADTMISAGMILPDTNYNTRVVRAGIEHWERLPGDPTFPLPD
jgi:hypothetical protein